MRGDYDDDFLFRLGVCEHTVNMMQSVSLIGFTRIYFCINIDLHYMDMHTYGCRIAYRVSSSFSIIVPIPLIQTACYGIDS